MTFATRIAAMVALLVLCGRFDPAFAQAQPARDHPREACQPRSGDAIRFYELRAADRIEEDLALVDGINTNRDVYVTACRAQLLARLNEYASRHKAEPAIAPSTLAYTAVVEVRAWHKPKEGGWREMRLHEPDQQQVETFVGAGLGPEFWGLQQVLLLVKADTIVDPGILIPLRRDAVKAEDVVRIRVRTEIVETAVLEKRLLDIANPQPKQKSESSTSPTRPVTALDNEEIIDSTYQVGRFGLHVVFSDLVVFVQRLGEDAVNEEGTNPVVFDSANFRPAPGASYGFTYYNRRSAFLRFLEPGFGAHLVFLNWTDRSRLAPQDMTHVTALQLGVGVMGSMFDGTVVAVFGSNLHVKDHRPYFGVGFSVTGMVRKLSRFLAD